MTYEKMTLDIFLKLIVGIAIGLIFIFWKGIEDIDFFYMFDGKRKESRKWRRFKRLALGLGILAATLAVLYKALKGMPYLIK